MIIKKVFSLAVFGLLVIHLAGLVPVHPRRSADVSMRLWDNLYEESVGRSRSSSGWTIDPLNNFLVLRVEFTDVKFATEAVAPANHPQNLEYFSKYMEHARSFYLDASSGRYDLQYTMVEQVFTASNTMAHYGNDDNESVMRVRLINEVIQLAVVAGVDFTGYEGVVLFHAGAGQETDIDDSQTHTLMSAFITSASFRAVFDPDNDDYQGIEANPGVYVKRVAFLPACEHHAYFDTVYAEYNFHFELLGPLTQQVGRLMGLPSLSGRGGRAGVGSFCVMGTGIWNNDGKTPPLPSAWIRVAAGWAEAVTVGADADSLAVIYPMAKIGVPPLPTPQRAQAEKIYKVEITEKEYFLIENRQHNPVRDRLQAVEGPYTGAYAPFRIYTFEIAEDQDFYRQVYDDGTVVLIPMVNLMKNNLRGSEWDFFIPYVPDWDTGSFVDPSGLLIWHIDENVIESNLANGLTINYNYMHKGVALEEADGLNHLDSLAPTVYQRGSPFDSFSALKHEYEGNDIKETFLGNDYFGHKMKPFNDTLMVYSFPDAGSYYSSDINLEIFNISVSDTVMTFSVRFEPFSQVDGYEEENLLEPFAFDFDGNGVNEVLYFLNNSEIAIFENHILKRRLNILGGVTEWLYTFDGDETLVIPTQDGDTARLWAYSGGNVVSEVWSEYDSQWIGSPVYVTEQWEVQDSQVRWILSVKSSDVYTGREIGVIYLLDEDFAEIINVPTASIYSNISQHKERMVYINYQSPLSRLMFHSFTQAQSVFRSVALPISAQHGTTTVSQGYFWGDEQLAVFVHHINFDKENMFFIFNENDGEVSELPFDFPYTLTGQVLFHDVNNNGKVDVILPHSNGFMVYSMAGTLIKEVTIANPDYEDESGSGMIAAGDHYIGGFSQGRVMIFDKDFRVVRSKTLGRTFSTFPFVTMQGDEVMMYQATDKGRIYNIPLPEVTDISQLTWSQMYGNCRRDGYWSAQIVNDYAGINDIFVKDETFIYPNPFIARHHEELKFQIMTTADTEVEVMIYTITGQLMARKSEYFEGLVKQDMAFMPRGWSSGVYFAVIKAQGKTLTRKFAVER